MSHPQPAIMQYMGGGRGRQLPAAALPGGSCLSTPGTPRDPVPQRLAWHKGTTNPAQGVGLESPVPWGRNEPGGHALPWQLKRSGHMCRGTEWAKSLMWAFVAHRRSLCLPLRLVGMAHPSSDRQGRPEDEDGWETGGAPEQRPGHALAGGTAARWHRSYAALSRLGCSWLGDRFLAARGIVCVISCRFVNCSDAADARRFLACTASSRPTSRSSSGETQRWGRRNRRSKQPGIQHHHPPHPARAPEIHGGLSPGSTCGAPRGTSGRGGAAGRR